MRSVPDIGVTVRSLYVTTVLKKRSASKIARRWFGLLTGDTIPARKVRHGVSDLLHYGIEPTNNYDDNPKEHGNCMI